MNWYPQTFIQWFAVILCFVVSFPFVILGFYLLYKRFLVVKNENNPERR